MTKRIITAMENENVDIIGHPTGRLINEREPYDVELDDVFKKAGETNTWLEINSFPSRLDLKDVYIKKAKEFGVKFTIGTDSHNLDQMRFIELGIATARRGWAEKKDIINSLSFNQLKKILKI